MSTVLVQLHKNPGTYHITNTYSFAYIGGNARQRRKQVRKWRRAGIIVEK